MAKTEPQKRQLNYKNFDDMMADVRTLHSGGYSRHGSWTLGQACGHVAEWMRFPLDGFPKPPLPMRGIFWFMRTTGMAKRMANKILAEGFTGGMPTAPDTVPDAEQLTDEQGVERLRQMVERVQAFDGELISSPLFGPMDKETHVKVSLLHAAHHLGYLEPKTSQAEA